MTTVEAFEDRMDSVRIDKWLWAARMFKTRSMATKACAAGHVKVDGDSAKASKVIAPGVEIDLLAPGGRRVLYVLALGDRRGPASEAQALYEDRTPEEPKPASPLEERPRGLGRPSKRDRRQLLKNKERW